jgi:uncharacterized phage infection (PIP) family protein YhgE
MANEDLEAWRQSWRDQWATSNDLLAGIRDAQGGIMTALDDLKVAVADNQTVSDRVATLVDTLQDQVGTLEATVADLVAQGNADLGEVTSQIAAITAELTAAEAPNTPPVEEPPVEPPMEM